MTVPYATLHRYAVAELGFGKGGTTIAVIEGEPGKEVQVDTGWVGWLQTPEGRRRLRAWIFTPVRSRYRFVYPTLHETAEEAIAACEAAWKFYGGVFGVLLPDNAKAIVEKADPLGARLSSGFLEYVQTRGFVVDPARARHPKDKARVERSVSHVRDDCFSGESLKTLEEARQHAEAWCREDYGKRIHSRTRRRPEEHFRQEEKARLLPEPTTAYDVPRWSAATVERDQYVPVSRGLYSVPTKYVGKKLTARTDSQTVRLYEAGVLVKVHTRVGAGERATDPNDFPEAKRIYAHRDVQTLVGKARELGENVGLMAETIRNQGAERAAVIFYGTTLLVISVLFAVLARVVARDPSLLREEFDDTELRQLVSATTPNIAFYGVTMGLALLLPRVAAVGYLVIAVVEVLRVRGDETVAPAAASS